MATSDSFAGQLLVAVPQMQDRRFERTVIYLCVHTRDGAMGLVLNRELDSLTFADLLKQVSVGPIPPARELRLCAGGPVDPSRGFALHTTDWSAGSTLSIDERLALTADLEILKALAGGSGPRDGVLALGYAGWGAGQLEREIKQNAWIIVPVTDLNLIFAGSGEGMWRQALALLKIDPSLLSNFTGHA